MILTDYFRSKKDLTWDIAKQCGVNHGVIRLPETDDFDLFIENIVDFYCVSNMLHPFREGNGRTQRVFISQLIRKNGFDIDFSLIDNDELIIATIHAANGVTDYLKDIFRRIIKKY